MIGPGFGEEIGRRLVGFIITVVLVALVVGALLATGFSWLLAHIHIAWSK